MKLLVILTICYVTSAQVQQLDVGATFDNPGESRQSRLLDENGEPAIITEPQPGDEYVLISASTNQNGVRQGRQLQSLFKEPVAIETGFRGVEGTFRTGKEIEVQTEAPAFPKQAVVAEAPWAPLNDELIVGATESSAPIPVVKAATDLQSFSLADVVSAIEGERKVVESEKTHDNTKGRALSYAQKELKPVSAFKEQDEDTVAAASAVSSRTVVKRGPNGKDYEYEYLYYYDDTEEGSDEEYEDAPVKKTTQRATTTTTTTTTRRPTTTTRTKRVRTKATFAPFDATAPKISNSRGRIRLEEPSILNNDESVPRISNSRGKIRLEEPRILNKTPITNLKDNSIARAIDPNAEENKAVETPAKPEPVEQLVKEDEQPTEIVSEVVVSLDDPETEERPKTVEVKVEESPKQVEEEVSTLDDEEEVELEKTKVSDPDPTPVKVEPMIVHAHMMDSSEFSESQSKHHGDTEEDEATHAPFDLEHDLGSPTSSTPDELSENVPTEAPEVDRLPVATRFPQRIQAALELQAAAAATAAATAAAAAATAAAAAESTSEHHAAEDLPAGHDVEESEIQGVQEDADLKSIAPQLVVEKEADTTTDDNFGNKVQTPETVVQLSDNAHITNHVEEDHSENKSGVTEETVELQDVEENNEDDETATVQDTRVQEEVIAEVSEPKVEHHSVLVEDNNEPNELTDVPHKSNRLNDARAIQNLFALSQAINDEKLEIAREESAKEDNIKAIEAITTLKIQDEAALATAEKPIDKTEKTVVKAERTTTESTTTTKSTTTVQATEATTETPAPVKASSRTRPPGIFKPRVTSPQGETGAKPDKSTASTASHFEKQVSTTTRTPVRRTTSSSRFNNRKTSTTTTQAPVSEIANEIEGIEGEGDSPNVPVLTSAPTSKPGRQRVRPGDALRLQQRTRRPAAKIDEEVVTPPVTFELKRQRPLQPIRNGNPGRVNPLDRSRQRMSSTTTVAETLEELEATQAPEEFATNPEVEQEVSSTAKSTSTSSAAVTEENTPRPLRRRPSNNIVVSEKPRKDNVNPVVGKRAQPLGRKKSTTTTAEPEQKDEEEVEAEQEVVIATTTETAEEVAEVKSEITGKPTRLSILEQSRARRLKNRPSV